VFAVPLNPNDKNNREIIGCVKLPIEGKKMRTLMISQKEQPCYSNMIGED
jgi:hypothetical protein